MGEIIDSNKTDVTQPKLIEDNKFEDESFLVDRCRFIPAARITDSNKEEAIGIITADSIFSTNPTISSDYAKIKPDLEKFSVLTDKEKAGLRLKIGEMLNTVLVNRLANLSNNYDDLTEKDKFLVKEFLKDSASRMTGAEGGVFNDEKFVKIFYNNLFKSGTLNMLNIEKNRDYIRNEARNYMNQLVLNYKTLSSEEKIIVGSYAEYIILNTRGLEDYLEGKKIDITKIKDSPKFVEYILEKMKSPDFNNLDKIEQLFNLDIDQFIDGMIKEGNTNSYITKATENLKKYKIKGLEADGASNVNNAITDGVESKNYDNFIKNLKALKKEEQIAVLQVLTEALYDRNYNMTMMKDLFANVTEKNIKNPKELFLILSTSIEENKKQGVAVCRNIASSIKDIGKEIGLDVQAIHIAGGGGTHHVECFIDNKDGSFYILTQGGLKTVQAKDYRTAIINYVSTTPERSSPMQTMIFDDNGNPMIVWNPRSESFRSMINPHGEQQNFTDVLTKGGKDKPQKTIDVDINTKEQKVEVKPGDLFFSIDRKTYDKESGGGNDLVLKIGYAKGGMDFFGCKLDLNEISLGYSEMNDVDKDKFLTVVLASTLSKDLKLDEKQSLKLGARISTIVAPQLDSICAGKMGGQINASLDVGASYTYMLRPEGDSSIGAYLSGKFIPSFNIKDEAFTLIPTGRAGIKVDIPVYSINIKGESYVDVSKLETTFGANAKVTSLENNVGGKIFAKHILPNIPDINLGSYTEVGAEGFYDIIKSENGQPIITLKSGIDFNTLREQGLGVNAGISFNF